MQGDGRDKADLAQGTKKRNKQRNGGGSKEPKKTYSSQKKEPIAKIYKGDKVKTEDVASKEAKYAQHLMDAQAGSMCTAQDIQSSSQYMLFVSCTLTAPCTTTSQQVVEMVVDSGASNSVMSASMMQKLGLESRLSKHISGHATGVGQTNMLGILERITCTMVDAPQVEFELFFMVLDAPANTRAPFVLLGLDQLRRFQCILDLEDNLLRFGGKQGLGVPLLSREQAAQASLTKVMRAHQEAIEREHVESLEKEHHNHASSEPRSRMKSESPRPRKHHPNRSPGATQRHKVTPRSIAASRSPTGKGPYPPLPFPSSPQARDAYDSVYIESSNLLKSQASQPRSPVPSKSPKPDPRGSVVVRGRPVVANNVPSRPVNGGHPNSRTTTTTKAKSSSKNFSFSKLFGKKNAK